MNAPGRLVCPQCGANNFATQAACWKCNTRLAGRGADRPAPSLSAVPVDAEAPHIAPWAAVALGLSFPFFAMPIGLIFLMLDSRRRSHIGRIALLWGTIGTILHLIGTIVALQGTVTRMRALIPALSQGRDRAPFAP